MEPEVCDAMGWFAFDELPEPMVAYCRAGLDAYRAGARMGVHFQEPGDPIAYDPALDRTLLVPGPGSHHTGPDDAVRDFAERAVGRITGWTDVSWAREESRVWRAHGVDGGEWYVKIHQNQRFHQREVAALREWVPGLGGAGPRLVAADATLRAVVLTAVDGRPLHGMVLPSDEERRVFRAIGELTARIHASPLPAASPGTAPVVPHAKLERHLEGARPHLKPGDEEYVRSVVDSAVQLPAVEAVVTHGDLQLRNLLRAGDGALRVIDFERSEPQSAVRDLVRLLDCFDGREDLYEAFFDGYGRRLTKDERARLLVETVLDAVSGIAFGSKTGDPELVERGHRTLVRCRAGAAPYAYRTIDGGDPR
jgi:tRNA A-37 threonylcarbamoyl transferase component Bud32